MNYLSIKKYAWIFRMFKSAQDTSFLFEKMLVITKIYRIDEVNMILPHHVSKQKIFADILLVCESSYSLNL